jgi:hypothetical protein
MKEMQSPGPNAALDGVLADAERDELPPAHHAVLPAGKHRDPTVCGT